VNSIAFYKDAGLSQSKGERKSVVRARSKEAVLATSFIRQLFEKLKQKFCQYTNGNGEVMAQILLHRTQFQLGPAQLKP
jgi:hypothetical protein